MSRLATACCLLLAAAPAIAAESRLERAQDCARVEAGPERLACYDALFRSAASAAALPAPVQPDEEFGLNPDQRERRRQEQGAAPAPDSITSRVTAVQEPFGSPVVLTLENGQRWQLLENPRFPPFVAGDDVTIRRAAIGSFLATAAARKGSWRVRRLD